MSSYRYGEEKGARAHSLTCNELACTNPMHLRLSALESVSCGIEVGARWNIPLDVGYGDVIVNCWNVLAVGAMNNSGLKNF